ncbi:MAG: rod-binding protein [Alphaproteobacteria bacterium]|nr:rod-binding protein [Alphaproteobacteria bacterium]
METGITNDFLDLAQVQRRTADPRQNLANGEDAARAAAKDFEAVFISQMLEQMFSGIKTDGPFGGGSGEGIFRSLMLQEYGRTIADNGGIGIADNVMSELMRMQEAH